MVREEGTVPFTFYEQRKTGGPSHAGLHGVEPKLERSPSVGKVKRTGG